MAWNFVSSRRLQTGHRYGVWLTSRGVTSTDEVARWLRNVRWSDVTLLPRGTLPSGQMIKELHGIWAGEDGAVLPTADRLLGYGPLYLAGSPTDDPGDVPNRAPGERPPPGPEVEEAMRRANSATKPSPWKGPVLVAAGLGLLILIHGKRPQGAAMQDDDESEGDDDATT
jgi:hypothetical protein